MLQLNSVIQCQKELEPLRKLRTCGNLEPVRAGESAGVAEVCGFNASEVVLPQSPQLAAEPQASNGAPFRKSAESATIPILPPKRLTPELAVHWGLEMEPHGYSWLNVQLQAAGSKAPDVLDQYVSEWLAGMEAEPKEIKKQGRGRFRANSWLFDRATGKHK